MDTHEYDYWLQCTRLRSERQRKRMQREDETRQLIRKHKEQKAIWTEMRKLGWAELKPPVQRGFVRYFVLRPDVARTKEAPFFQKLLNKINTQEWSSRKDFKKKRRRFGKKVYVVREQRLKDVWLKDFIKDFSDKERAYFDEVLVHMGNCKTPCKVYRFSEAWRFVLKVQPNMINKVRVKNLDLEKRQAELDKFFDFDRKERLWRLLDCTYKWNHHSKNKYKSPLVNRTFASVLDEHSPELQMNVTFKNPRNSEGFSFKEPNLLAA